jgi:hypothetical protein
MCTVCSIYSLFSLWSVAVTNVSVLCSVYSTFTLSGAVDAWSHVSSVLVLTMLPGLADMTMRVWRRPTLHFRLGSHYSAKKEVSAAVSKAPSTLPLHFHSQ